MIRTPITLWRLSRGECALSRPRLLISVGVILCFVLAWFAPPLSAGQFREIVAFADSWTDTGNVFAATGSTSPDPTYYYQGRWSNGPVWVERLASDLGLPDPTASRLGGTNNAWASAETGLSGNSWAGWPNIGTQITNYLRSNSSLDAGQLLVVWGVGNDILFAGQTDPSIPVSNLSQEITILAQHGGKYFLVPNFPVIDLPAYPQWDPQKVAQSKLLLNEFNSLLAAELTGLQTTLGITIFQFDVAGLAEEIVKDPAAFGFTNVTERAKSGPAGQPGTVVSNPDQYLFWDSVHPSRVFHQIIGDRALGAMFSFAVVAPLSVASGSSFDLTVTAVDPFGDIDVNYQGTVTFSTSDTDPGIVLPADYTFTQDDAGMHTFPGAVTLITPGNQTVTVTEKATGITGVVTITVAPDP